VPNIDLNKTPHTPKKLFSLVWKCLY